MRDVYEQIPSGERVRDGLGHVCEVVSGGPYQYVVQPMTPKWGRPGLELVEYGCLIRVCRSDIRRDDEA